MFNFSQFVEFVELSLSTVQCRFESLVDRWIVMSRGLVNFVHDDTSSQQNVRPYRSVLVVSSASFSVGFVLLTESSVSSASSSDELVLLTESLHHSNSSVEFRSYVSLVTNATSRHESMTTKVTIIFTNSPQQAASNHTIDRQFLRAKFP